MRAPIQGPCKVGLVRPHNPNPMPQIRGTINDQSLSQHDTFAHLSDATHDSRQTTPTKGSESRSPCHGRGRRLLLRLFVDGDHFPEDFRLETHPSLRDREKALRDALMPILRGPHLWPSDPGRTAGESGGPRTILASKAGRFKQVKPQHIPTRTKRTPSHLASSSEKRHQRLKSSPMSPSEVATEPAATVHLATQAVRLEQDVTNACNDEESEDDDGWVVVFEEGTVLLRADDTEKITEFIRVTFELMGQVVLRNIMKAWIKILEPGKQTTHQYNGGKTPSGDPENPGRYTAPPWWCDQDDWMIGRGCRHKEPDHVLKKERLFFSPKLLRFTSSDHPRGFTVQRLKESTDQIEMSAEQRRLLGELYRLREDEQSFEEGERDGDAVTYMQKVKPRAAKTKKKSVKASEGKKEVKQECRGAPAPLEQMTPAQASTSRTGSIYSSFDSTLSPVTVKSEHVPQVMCRTPSLQASLRQYGATSHTNDMFDRGNTVVPDSNPDEMSGICGRNEHLLCDEEDYVLVDPMPFAQAPPGHNDFLTGERAGYPLVNERFTGQLPIRPDNDVRRLASAANEASPSCQRWGPNTSLWSFEDDTNLRLQMAHAPAGNASGSPFIPFTAPDSYSQVLPTSVQQQLCAENNYPLTYRHDWRPARE